MLKPSVSQPYVVCGESLSRAVVHGLRVVELRVVTWYMSNIRVKWVQLLKPPHSSCVSCSNLEMLLTMIKFRETKKTLRGLELLDAVQRFRAAVCHVLV